MCKRQLYHGIISSKTSSKPNKPKFGYLIQLNKPYLAYFINFVCPHATLTGSNNVILTLIKELWYIRIRRENGLCSYESWSQLQNNVLTITKIRRNALCQLYKQNQLQTKDFCALKSCYSNHKSKILKTTSHSFLFFSFSLFGEDRREGTFCSRQEMWRLTREIKSCWKSSEGEISSKKCRIPSLRKCWKLQSVLGMLFDWYVKLVQIKDCNSHSQILIKEGSLFHCRYWFRCFPKFTPQITWTSRRWSFIRLTSSNTACSELNESVLVHNQKQKQIIATDDDR